jgi:putative solute:sodium symporter small subunit
VLVSGCFPALEAGEEQFSQMREAIMAYVPKALTSSETPVVSLDGEAETGQSVIWSVEAACSLDFIKKYEVMTMPEASKDRSQAYWKRNLLLIFRLMLVWFAVSFGCGILLFDTLNQITVGGYKLGFWFAQQGAIYVFVILIFYYSRKMTALDREFSLEED